MRTVRNVLYTCKHRVKKCKSKTEKDYSITFLYIVPMTISINESLSSYIEEKTRGQRACSLWRDLHKGRITSSLFGAVLSSGTNPVSLVNQIVNGSNLDRYIFIKLRGKKIFN